MKTTKLSISQATALSGAIQQLSEKGDDKKPVYSLPFKFAYALGRTLTKLQEALKPIQEANQEIFDGWDEENRKHQARIKAATGDAKDKAIAAHSKAFKVRNDKWKAVANGEIEVEIYELPKLTEDERDEIIAAKLTPSILSDLDPLGLNLFDEAA